MAKRSLIPERVATWVGQWTRSTAQEGDMAGEHAGTDYERFQCNFFLALVHWMIAVLVAAVLINSYWFLIDFQSTLIQNSVFLLLILMAIWSLRLARRGRMRLASRLYLLSGMVLLASVLLVIGQNFILNIAAGLYIIVLIAMFLDQPSRAVSWAGAGMAFYVVGLTLRILLPVRELTYSTEDIAALYLFPIILLGAFALLGHKLARSLCGALTEGERARDELSHRNQELCEAQSSLEATNERLHLDLAERLRIERQLRISQKELQISLHEKEILLQEVHHRVKNNLQVISSLLDMQSYYTQDPQAVHALQESQSRVRAMAFVHERLYRSSDLASVDAQEYIRSIATYLFGLYAGSARCIDLSVEVEDVCLDLGTAIPCGLIVNELISNALKHAFPAGGECDGKIRVALSSRGDGAMQLMVGDSGVGLPDAVAKDTGQSLGLRLVHMLTQELGGAMEVHTGDGTTIAIIFAR